MTTPTPIYRYPLDGTGKSPDNLVVGEEHQLSNRTVRCVAPTYGGFFAESVVVKDLATNMPLVKGPDYYFGELFEFPTGRYGKEIFGIIVITKPGVTKIAINYQALGGDYSYSMDAVIAMLDNLNLGERPAEWGMIIGRPTLFDPAAHFHDAGDVYGFEYVVHAIDLLKQAIILGDVASHDEIYAYIDKFFAGQGTSITAVQAALNAHIADRNNPHVVTKDQVGLGNVGNYPVATNAVALSGTSTQHYITPSNLVYVVNQIASNALATHIADKSNPHGVTKTQIGLSNVLNYGTADSATTITGTAADQYVTPKGVSDAINNWYAAGKFDSRYIVKNQMGVESSISVAGGIAYISVGGAWKQFWPPIWQA
jgi:hypothetical protein